MQRGTARLDEGRVEADSEYSWPPGVPVDVNPTKQTLSGVLVVGGGYAGLHAVRAAEREGVGVTLLDASPEHSFATRLAAVSGGTAPESDASIPLDELADTVLIGRMSEVGDGWIRLDDGRTLEADAVVVTTGAETSRPPIPGLDLAATMRTAADARALRGRIAEADAVAVVGGGASGVQLAAATAQAHPSTTVHLVEAGTSLLPGMASTMGRNAARILEQRGVQVHLQTAVDEISEDGVHTSKGWISGIVVWVGGFAADASSLGLPVDDAGRVLIDDDLSVQSMERTFAAGDIAAHRDGDGAQLPMSAQVAVRAGTAAGRNAARLIKGARTRSVQLAQLGWVMDLSGGRGLAELGPLPAPTLQLGDRRLALGPFPLAAPLLDLVPPLLHDGIDAKNVLEIAGLGALVPWNSRFAAWPGITWRGSEPAVADAPDISGAASVGSAPLAAEVARPA
jgi:NADH dehydrogenase